MPPLLLRKQLAPGRHAGSLSTGCDLVEEFLVRLSHHGFGVRKIGQGREETEAFALLAVTGSAVFHINPLADFGIPAGFGKTDLDQEEEKRPRNHSNNRTADPTGGAIPGSREVLWGISVHKTSIVLRPKPVKAYAEEPPSVDSRGAI